MTTRQALYARRERARRKETGECLDAPRCGPRGHPPAPGKVLCERAIEQRRRDTERRLGRKLRSGRGRPPKSEIKR